MVVSKGGGSNCWLGWLANLVVVETLVNGVLVVGGDGNGRVGGWLGLGGIWFLVAVIIITMVRFSI